MGRDHKRAGKKIKITLLAVLLGAALYCLWCYSLKDAVIWENLVINGVNVQGMTKREAKKAVRSAFEKEYQDKSLTIRLADTDYQAYIFPALDFSASELIEEAFVLGHGKWFTRGTDRIRLMMDKNKKREETILPTIAGDQEISRILSYTEIEKVNTVQESSCRITDSSLILKKGKTGVRADMEKLKEALKKALEEQDYETVLVCPSLKVSPKELKLQKYYDKIYREPEDAAFDQENDCAVIPSQNGVSFDVKEAEKKFREAEEGSTLVIDFTVTEPAITTEDMDGRICGDILGSYTTYGGGTSDRITNLTLAAKACDGVELQPGESFSYNETLGERTAERGYKSAGVFVNGQPAEGLGGGICQVSTTLFMACLYANLEIVQRSNHSGRVEYVPAGMDAAVSWGNPDFVFRNNTDYPIKISADYTDGTVNVKIYGTKVHTNTVKITTEQLDAASYKTYRSVYDASGTLLKTEEICTSHYKS